MSCSREQRPRADRCNEQIPNRPRRKGRAMAIRYLLIASVSAGALFAGTAHAQQTAQANNAATQPPTNAPPSGGAQPAPTDTGEGSNIVITGFRRSIAASIRAKRNSAVIADILTAEDIGKFPDKNVAEALQRIPGV